MTSRSAGWAIAVFAIASSYSISAIANDRFTFSGTNHDSLGAAEAAMRAAAGPVGPSLQRCGEGTTSGSSSTITYCAPTRTPVHWFDQYSIAAIADRCPVTDPNLGPRCRDEATAVDLMVQHYQASTTAYCFVSSSVTGSHAPNPTSWVKNSYLSQGVFQFAYLSYGLPQGPSPRSLVIQYRRCSNADAPIYAGAYPISAVRHFTCPSGWTPIAGRSPSRFSDACVAPTYTITKSSAQNATSCPRTGHPCSPFTGEKLLTEVDLDLPGLRLTRHYASGRDTPSRSGLGDTWSFSLAHRLAVPGVQLGSSESPQLRDGQNNLETFSVLSATLKTYSSNITRGRVLQRVTASQWVLTDASGLVQVFDGLGRLTQRYDRDAPANALTFSYEGELLKRITTPTGRTYQLLWSSDRLASITGPDDSELLVYVYDSANRLSSVTHADGRQRVYHYGEPTHLCVGASSSCQASFFSNHLTGVTDENGVRRLDALYDGSGRVVASDERGAASKTDVVYSGPTTTEVVESGQGRVVWTFTRDLARRPLTRTTFIGTAQVSAESWAYLNDGSVRHTDARGVVTRTHYNTSGLPTSIVEGESIAGSATSPLKRTIVNTWSTDPVQRLSTTELRNAAGVTLLRTERQYTPEGQLRLVRQVDPARSVARSTESTFCTSSHVADPSEQCPIVGLLRTTVAPGNAVTRYRYYTADAPGCSPSACDYRRGDLASVTNALGHAIAFNAYDPFGRPARMTSANGLVTTYRYASNGRPDRIDAGGLVTELLYTSTGKLRSASLPSGETLVYGYDANDRLETITDATGARLQFTLDDAGHPTSEERKTASGSVAYRLSRGIDALGRIRSVQQGLNSPSGLTYTAFDDLDRSTDPLGRVSDADVDPFGRPLRLVEDLGGLAALQSYTHTPLDHLETVTDPKGLVTRYTRNALGDLLTLESPDTGTTTYTYDAAGYVDTRTDARGFTVDYDHDVLGRPTEVSYPDPSLNTTFAYDSASGCPAGETYAVGQLSSMTDAIGTTRWCYDQLGRLTRKVQLTNAQTFTTAYTYDAQGRLATQTLPSGAVVRFGYQQGRVATVSVRLPGSTTDTPLISAIERLPFGPVSKLTYGNGRTQTRAFDLAFGIDAISSSEASGWTADYGLDAAGDVTSILGTGGNNRFGYDGLRRLNKVDDVASQPRRSFGYDATGNRTSETPAGAATTLTYPPSSHRLSAVGAQSRTYDAMGNPITVGALQLRYDQRAKLDQVTLPSGDVWRNQYNGHALRTSKWKPSDPSNRLTFVYNEAAQLIGEYDSAGSLVSEVLWLDNLPIGVITMRSGTPVLSYIESDHLGTPRVVVDPVRNTTIWRWNQTDDPFGQSAATEDPDADGSLFAFHLRFAGQYRDAETGWHYNVHRYYDPATGRYLESDPIGLGGGISTYAYSASTPLIASDPLGLACNSQGCWPTPAELAYAASGNYGLYYQAACSGGDAYACRAREVSMGRPGLFSLTGITNARLGASMFERLDGGMSCEAERQKVEQQMERVRQQLAMAHANALINAGALPSSPAQLTREQIGDFHREVFSNNGASPDVFGGSTYDSLFGAFGRLAYDWCPSPSCSP